MDGKRAAIKNQPNGLQSLWAKKQAEQKYERRDFDNKITQFSCWITTGFKVWHSLERIQPSNLWINKVKNVFSDN